MSDFEKALKKKVWELVEDISTGEKHENDDDFINGARWAHDLMTKELEEVKSERDWILKVGQVRKDNVKLRTDLALAVEEIIKVERAIILRASYAPYEIQEDLIKILNKINQPEGDSDES